MEGLLEGLEGLERSLCERERAVGETEWRLEQKALRIQSLLLLESKEAGTLKGLDRMRRQEERLKDRLQLLKAKAEEVRRGLAERREALHALPPSTTLSLGAYQEIRRKEDPSQVRSSPS